MTTAQDGTDARVVLSAEARIEGTILDPDVDQRPSRHCLAALAQRAEGLGQQGVTLIPIQATETDPDVLKGWLDEQGIRTPVGRIQAEADARTALILWGVRSLPWLILTDAQHVVRAEGFAVGELDVKIEPAGP